MCVVETVRMYKNLTLTGKIFGNKKRITFIVIFVIILICMILFVYNYERNKFLSKENSSIFEQLIVEYCTYINTLKDTEIDLFINSFNDETLLDSVFSKQGSSWFQDVELFGNNINNIFGLLAAVVEPKSKYYRNEKIWNIIQKTIEAVSPKVNIELGHQTYPFGGNWYQFSISYPRFLVATSYMRGKFFKDAFQKTLRQHLAQYISKYFKVPTSSSEGVLSMGYRRDGSNAVMMAVPYIGGMLYLGKEKQLKNNNICKYVDKFTYIESVTSGDGFYADKSFVFHGNLRAFGYITSALPDFILISKYFKHDVTKSLIASLSITEHPDLKVHFGPWFGRTPSFSTSTSRMGTYGFYVLDKFAGISVKTKKFLSCFNLQRKELCFYEADKSQNKWGLVWLQLRQPFDKNTPQKYTEQMVTGFSGIFSYKNKVPLFETTTSTTTGFVPDEATSIICKLNTAIGGYNKYKIDNSNYSIAVEELTLNTQNGIHCIYNVDVDYTATLPLHFGCYMGKSIESTNSANIYKLDNNKTLYIHTPEVIQPNKTEITTIDDELFHSLSIMFTRAGTIQCGFSIVYDSDSSKESQNELINHKYGERLETIEYTLKYSEGLLFLHSQTSQQCAISRFMETAGLKSILLPAERVNKIISINNKLTIFSENYYQNLINNRYQMLVNNTTMKTEMEHADPDYDE